MSGVHGSPSYGREELVAETASCFLLAETGLACAATSSETTARTAAYLSSWRQTILDDPKALMTAFAEAEKAADWVMQRHPFQLEAAAKAAFEGQAMGHEMGADTGVRQTRDAPECENQNNWVMPINATDWTGLGSFPMP
jgi:antirestriction protein ArdC